MDDLLHQLEMHITKLISERHELTRVNMNLQQGKQILNKEKDLIKYQHQKAITQIENLISRLKAIETLT